MAIFLTSDCHFNHQNIIVYEKDSRPFNTVEEMNEKIIENWNSVVSNDDEVYVLGDFFMGKIEDIEPILTRLNRKQIYLIRGNHDTSNRIKIYENHGIIVKDIAYLNYKGKFLILCHFPIASNEFVEMVRTNHQTDTVVCYGHIHSQAPHGYSDGTYHVGVDTNDLTPVLIDDLINNCWKTEEN